MRASKLRTSRYLSHADFDGPRNFQIESVELEEIDGRERGVMYFNGERKGLPLNMTNLNTAIKLFGDETDDWCGQWIGLYVTEVDFRGDRVPAIRLRAPERRAAPPRGEDDPERPARRRTAPARQASAEPEEDEPW
jgi:hypothetical protein